MCIFNFDFAKLSSKEVAQIYTFLNGKWNVLPVLYTISFYLCQFDRWKIVSHISLILSDRSIFVFCIFSTYYVLCFSIVNL